MRKKVFFIFCCIIPLNYSLIAQESKVDQILREYDGVDCVSELYDYGRSISYPNQDSIGMVAKIILNYCNKNNLSTEKTLGYTLMAVDRLRLRDYRATVKYCRLVINSKNCTQSELKCLGARQIIAKIFLDIGMYDKSLEQQLIALNSYEQNGEIHQLIRTNRVIGQIYFAKGNSEKGLSYLHKSLQLSNKRQQRYTVYRESCNSLGMAYMDLGNLDTAAYFFRKGLEGVDNVLELTEVSRRQYGRVAGNLGQVYFFQKDYQKAIPLLRLNKETNQSNGIKPTLIFASLFLGRAYTRTGDYRKAEENLEFARLKLKEANVRSNQKRLIKLRIDLHDAFSEYYLRVGNLEESYKSDSMFRREKDNLDREETLLKSQMLNAVFQELYDQEIELKNLENEQKEQQIVNMQQNDQLNNQRVIGLVSILLVMILVGLIVYLRSRLIRKKKIEIKTVEDQLKKSELEAKNNQLTYLSLDIARKYEFTNVLMDRLKKLKRKATNDTINDVNDLMIFARNELNIDQSIGNLQNDIESINSSFFERLVKIHPELTRGEQQLCSYLKLNLSNPEIAIIKGVTVKAVTVAKSRLRNKMNLEGRANIVQYLTRI